MSGSMQVYQSWWAMTGLGGQHGEWTMEEKFERIAEAGFKGILGRLPAPEEAGRWRKLLDRYELGFGIHSFPRSPEELAPLLREAKAFGVQFVNSQVMDHWVVGERAVELLQGLVEEAASADMPYYVETHRGRITQDLLRTIEYVERIPELRLTMDLSHYILGCEVTVEQEQMDPYFDKLLRRTSSIHARISNGEQIQVDLGAGGEHPMTPHFTRWWEAGMRYWRAAAAPGAVLPVVCELGPPPYSMELADRWDQALILKGLLERCWAAAVRT